MNHDTITRWQGQRLVTQRIPAAQGCRTAHDEPKLYWNGNSLEIERPIALTRKVRRAGLMRVIAVAIVATAPVTVVLALWFGVCLAMAFEVMR